MRSAIILLSIICLNAATYGQVYEGSIHSKWGSCSGAYDLVIHDNVISSDDADLQHFLDQAGTFTGSFESETGTLFRKYSGGLSFEEIHHGYVESIFDSVLYNTEVTQPNVNELYVFRLRDLNKYGVLEILEFGDSSSCSSGWNTGVMRFKYKYGECVNQLPISDFSLCSGNDSLISLPENMLSYSWSNGVNTNEILVSNAGTYSVTVVDTFSCTLEQSINVSQLDTPVIVINESNSVLTANTSQSVNSYQWYLNNDVLVGQIFQSLTINADGQYHVIVVNNSGCEARSPNFDHNSTSSIRDVYHREQIKIYPNPTSTVVNISEDHIVNQVTVFDLKGQVVLSENSKNTVDVSELLKGLYVIHVNTNNGVFASKLIIE